MGNRAIIRFSDGYTDIAAVYLHDAGSEAHSLLELFFQAEDGNTRHDNRFSDPEYLAARFIVFMYERWGRRGNGIGVADPHAEYDGYPYRVLCTNETHPGVVSPAGYA